MNTELTLYESKASPNSRRVRIFLAEKGLDIPTKTVNLGEKEQFSAAYVAINPRRQVPALVLQDGTTIGEVPAIWRYVEEAYPAKPALLGTTPHDAGDDRLCGGRHEDEHSCGIRRTAGVVRKGVDPCFFEGLENCVSTLRVEMAVSEFSGTAIACQFAGTKALSNKCR